MKHLIATAAMASSPLFSSNVLAASSLTVQKESPPEQSGSTFKCSTDSKITTEQKNVYDVITKYQNALNAGNTKTVLGLFADESYPQWSDKLAAGSTEKRQGWHDDLFKRERFETDLALDSIWISGDIAVARTHHRVGSTVANFKEQKAVIDLNREAFALNKINGEWKIFLYTFNTNPLRGVA